MEHVHTETGAANVGLHDPSGLGVLAAGSLLLSALTMCQLCDRDGPGGPWPGCAGGLWRGE